MFTRHTTPSVSTFFAALLAVGLLWPGGEARAQVNCTLASGVATCVDQPYSTGILFEAGDAWGAGIAGDAAVTVTGGPQTTITAPAARTNPTWRNAGIVLRTSSGTSRDIALTVGTGSNAVVIREHGSQANMGIYIHQGSTGADDTTVTLGSGVTIGSTSARMMSSGINMLVLGAANTGTHTITSAAAIHATNFGINLLNRSAGAVVVMNSDTITTAATGGNANEKIGIRVTVDTPVDASTAPVTVTNSGTITVTAANAHGISVDATGARLHKIVNSGTIASGAGGHGIYVDGRRYKGTAGAGGVEIENSGSITSSGTSSNGIYVEASGAAATGTDPITIMNSGNITAGAFPILVNSDLGPVTVTASDGTLETTGAFDGIAIQQNADADMTVTSGADITAGTRGIRVQATTAATTGDISITTTGGSIKAEGDGMDGIWPQDHAAHTGSVTISNAADITADRYGIYANRLGAGTVSVTNTGGTVLGKKQAGIYAANQAGDATDVTVSVTDGTVRSTGQSTPAIVAENRGTGDVTVTIEAPEGNAEAMPTLISQYNAGVYANLPAADNTGKITIAQHGTIAARKGVYARVGRASAEGVSAEGEIGVTWSGTFSHESLVMADGTTAAVSQDDMGRFVSGTLRRSIDIDREVQTEKTIRYGSAAGIEAQVMSWRDMAEEVAKGDAPAVDPIADEAARLMLFDPTSTTDADLKAKSDALVAQALLMANNDDVMIEAESALATLATAVDANGDEEFDATEITTYLTFDGPDNRAALHDLLARGLSEAEKEVLRALATGDRDAVAAALTAAGIMDDAADDDDHWSKVMAFLDRHNVGNISVVMYGGSIDSRGDGIRAYYATPHAMNGRIDVEVVEGASVTGGMAGIYVANAGVGDAIDPDWRTTLKLGDAAVTGLRQHYVTVNGTVTGGTDAAVHLAGGGLLHVGSMGMVLAGDSGVGVLVNGPGVAHLFIEGEVRGAEGGAAAVHLKGGGSVRVGKDGMVLANGAARAIQGDNEPTTVVVEVAASGTTDTGYRYVADDGTTLYRQGVQNANARVSGGIAGDGITGRVRLAVVDEEGMMTGMGMGATLDPDGTLSLSGFPSSPHPPCPEGQVRGDDGMCAEPPPSPPMTMDCPEGQVRGADGMCAEPPPSPPMTMDCPEGQVRGADGMCRIRSLPLPPADGRVDPITESQSGGIRYGYEPEDSDRKPLVVTVAAGATVTSAGAEAGIELAGADLRDVERNSELGRSLYLRADEMNLRQHIVTVHGTVIGGTGDAAVHLVGGGVLLVGSEGKVHARAGQPAVLVNDPGEAVIVIDGEVWGSDGASAAVHLTGGGSVTVGPRGRVDANGAEFAIRAQNPDGPTPATTVRLLVAADGMTEDGRRHVSADGTIVYREGGEAAAARVQGGYAGDGIRGENGRRGSHGRGVVKLAVADDMDGDGMIEDTGMGTEVDIKPDGELDLTSLDRELLTMDCESADDRRCRLYKALPSALLAMNGLPTYGERMSAARDARGGWALVEAARGKWKADSATQEEKEPYDLAYDHRRHGVRAGMDFAMGDAGGVGVSVHGLRGSAEMAQGEIDLSGAGVGVHVTRAFDGGFHVDAQAAVTWYHTDLKSMRGSTLKNDVNGRGYALGVEAGKRLPMDGGVAVTPRAGLLWSKADLDDFQDAGLATVSVKEAQSLKGRVGVGVEKVLGGDGMDGSRLFSSLDVEQEFKEETESMVEVSGTFLKASARQTRIRTAAGAVHVWDEGRYALQGSLGYTVGGGGNRDYGGGLSFVMRF